MPQPNKIPLAFAASGDKNIIPESTETTGLASWREGFPAITSAPFSEGGIAPKRADFNGIFNALSALGVWQQQGGVFAYDNTTDYEVGNLVVYSNELYICLIANGPNSAVKAPTDTTTWSKIANATTLASYLPLSGGTLTGALYTNDIYVDNSAIRSKADTQATIICGGVGWAHGAQISACGKNEPVNPGAFILRADNGNDSANLIGRPDGELSWQAIPLLNNGNFTKMFFSQTSGSYTAPYTGVYRITLKGGGGGGGACSNTGQGGGGGEGGLLSFYISLTKGTSYSYTIGAGGSGGIASPNTAPTAGGATTFNSGAYSVEGGAIGYHISSGSGGGGGQNFTVPAGVIALKLRGAPGNPGSFVSSSVSSPNGGGMGGGFRILAPGSGYREGIYGGGGQGGGSTSYPNGGAGGAGYILIEYAG